ncbi:MAG: aminoacyl-tRNA hydrolase [Pseudomonadota bacterium]
MNANDYLVVGLGNPGIQYCLNRHNVGFQIVDDLAERWGHVNFIGKWNAYVSSFSFSQKKIHLIKPQTFMNLSGNAVVQYYRFFKISPDQLLVVHDDLDMNSGRIKLVKGGGTGGHNGIRSLVDSLGTKDFYRLKIGIGRPGKGGVHPEFPVEKYVLSDFEEGERALMNSRYSVIEEGLRFFLEDTPEKAMGLLNGLK